MLKSHKYFYYENIITTVLIGFICVIKFNNTCYLGAEYKWWQVV